MWYFAVIVANGPMLLIFVQLKWFALAYYRKYRSPIELRSHLLTHLAHEWIIQKSHKRFICVNNITNYDNQQKNQVCNRSKWAVFCYFQCINICHYWCKQKRNLLNCVNKKLNAINEKNATKIESTI